MSSTKPEKPYHEFPLFPHASGQWAKKIRGRTYYFGKWDNWEAALQLFKEQVDGIQSGVVPTTKAVSLADVLNSFGHSKQQALEIGEINESTFREYIGVADTIAKLGKHRPFETINTTDLTKLRTMLAKGKAGQLVSPITHKRLLTFARMVFIYANTELGFNINFRKKLSPPTRAKIREHTNAIGPRMFEATEIKTLLEQAAQPLKSMILLGINCGFGPQDCCCVPTTRFDLDKGLHNFPRTKNNVPRDCTLWPETVEALREIMPRSGRVFTGRKWNRHKVADKFKELGEACGVYQEGTKTFYSLRRTVETIAKTAEVNQSVIDRIMGHERLDMSEVYNQKTFKTSLLKCTNYVHDWVYGSITLE
jgi:integrase